MEIPKNEHIRHAFATKRGPLSEQVAEIGKLTLTEALHLIKCGAIYVNKERNMNGDTQVAKDAYLRMHMFPKFYPVDKVDWEKAIVEQTEEFLILNKPSGIPLHATVDNYSENCAFQLQRHLKREIYVTHRLDRATRGLVVLAKTKEFQSWFNRMIIKKKIEKSYRALTEKQIPLGTHVHYMEPKGKTPMTVQAEENPEWLRCELIVQTSEPVQLQGKEYFESTIRLITGRTHQIRCQFQFLGSSILGDLMYGGREYPELGFGPEGHALQAYSLIFNEQKFVLDRFW